MAKLDQKVAVIIGGARGIAKEIAVTFAKEGSDIVIGDISDMKTVAEEVEDQGRKVVTVKTDVTKKREIENLIDTAINRLGKVDILINSAGFRRQASLLQMTEEDWDAVLDVNLKAVFLSIQVAAKHMIERKYGKIINLASVAGLMSGRSQHAGVNYQCSKAGVIILTRAAAGQLGPYGINVNAMAPGLIGTEGPFTQRTPEEIERMIETTKLTTPLGRIGTTEDISNLALFLASDDSSFITGQVITIDGGKR